MLRLKVISPGIILGTKNIKTFYFKLSLMYYK